MSVNNKMDTIKHFHDTGSVAARDPALVSDVLDFILGQVIHTKYIYILQDRNVISYKSATSYFSLKS